MHRKRGERRKVDNCAVDSRITCTGQKTRNVVHIKFSLLIDKIMITC